MLESICRVRLELKSRLVGLLLLAELTAEEEDKPGGRTNCDVTSRLYRHCGVRYYRLMLFTLRY